MHVDDEELLAALRTWLPAQRWFGGGGHAISRIRISSRTAVTGVCDHLVIEVGQQDWYQVPVVVLANEGTGLIARTHAGYLHDALAHGPSVHHLLSSSLEQVWLEGNVPTGPFRPLGAEQSNTSVVIGDSLMKFFRRLRHGPNPEVELHAGLARAQCHEVDELKGWMSGRWQDQEGHLAVVTEFLPDAVSASDLASAALARRSAFTAESSAVGATTARVHQALAQSFPVTRVEAALVKAQVVDRLDAVAEQVPAVVSLAPALLDRLEPLSTLGSVPVQRIHGDLHLSQVLSSQRSWRIVDFEGEPGADIAARRRPDNCARDIAGLLRSLDYVRSMAGETSVDWRTNAAQALLDGYRMASGQTLKQDLLTAYLIDKAAYEVLYEMRHRPQLAHIPLSALQELAGQPR